jgi:hypothetical protein
MFDRKIFRTGNIVSLAPSPLGQVGMARVDRGARWRRASEGRQSTSALSGSHLQVALAAPTAASRTSRPWLPACAADCGEACGPMHIASRAPAGPSGRQLTDTMVEHRSRAPSPPWAGRVARVDRTARVAKRQRGAAIDVPPRKGSPFHATTPRLVCCNDFKDAIKAAAALLCPSSAEPAHGFRLGALRYPLRASQPLRAQPLMGILIP